MTTLRDSVVCLTGESLSKEMLPCGRHRDPLRLISVHDAVAPVEAHDVVEIVRVDNAQVGNIALYVHDDALRLGRLVGRHDSWWRIRTASGDVTTIADDDIAGIVRFVEKDDVLLDATQGRWASIGRLLAHVPATGERWGHRLAQLERLRHPLFPPLFMGSPEQLLAHVGEAYAHELHLYARNTALTAREEAWLGSHLRSGMRLLVVGCGAGRETIAFAREGLDVTGIDVAPLMVDLSRDAARAADVSASFECAEPLTFSGPRPFDAIYFPPGSYAHLPGRARRIATLRHLRRDLAPSGVVILTAWWRPPLGLTSRTRVVDALRRIGRAVGLRRISEPGDHYYSGARLTRFPASWRYLKHFSGPDEIVEEIEAAGLRVIECPEPDLRILRTC